MVQAGDCVLGRTLPRTIVIDSGTGTTATGFAIGVALLGCAPRRS